jgi:phosphatidylinositol-3-phosphatase
MFKKAAALGLALSMIAAPMFANEGAVPRGVPHLDHVFVIMMENHGYDQVFGNPSEPYLNAQIAGKKVNLATNYFAIGHPSLTNYLEVVGGSNFGVRSDNSPNWHSATPCSPNLVTGIVNADNFGGNAPVTFESASICPISGVGQDADTPAVDNWNEVAPPQFAFLADIDGVKSVPHSSNVDGKTIADQLVKVGLSWKSYQESLPAGGADGVNNSDGFFSDTLIPVTSVLPNEPQSLIKLYAVKHNPFAYFKTVQDGVDPNNSLNNVVGLEGAHGLFEDLSSGHVPSLSFIAPNQCNDQHGRGNAGPQCDFDPNSTGTQYGLNPALIYYGDLTIRNIVAAIHASPVWSEGRNAIVIVWDENDYSGTPTAPQGLFPSANQNRVVLTVETNAGPEGVKSDRFYDSFSLLKSIEGGFGLPCLNHACDSGVHVMSDLFGAGHDE